MLIEKLVLIILSLIFFFLCWSFALGGWSGKAKSDVKITKCVQTIQSVFSTDSVNFGRVVLTSGRARNLIVEEE